MRVIKTMYNHHMLVVEVVNATKLKVIHYTGGHGGESLPESFQATGLGVTTSSSSGFCTIAKVIEEELSIIDLTNVELLKYPGKLAKYTGQAAISRAEEKIKEAKYHLLFNNCESFVNWCITDLKYSNQGEKAAENIAGVAAVGGVAAGIGGVVCAIAAAPVAAVLAPLGIAGVLFSTAIGITAKVAVDKYRLNNLLEHTD